VSRQKGLWLRLTHDELPLVMAALIFAAGPARDPDDARLWRVADRLSRRGYGLPLGRALRRLAELADQELPARASGMEL
jgi:hypothetical protein